MLIGQQIALGPFYIARMSPLDWISLAVEATGLIALLIIILLRWRRAKTWRGRMRLTKSLVALFLAVLLLDSALFMSNAQRYAEVARGTSAELETSIAQYRNLTHVSCQDGPSETIRCSFDWDGWPVTGRLVHSGQDILDDAYTLYPDTATTTSNT